jgi:hypothetical protein
MNVKEKKRVTFRESENESEGKCKEHKQFFTTIYAMIYVLCSYKKIARGKHSKIQLTKIAKNFQKLTKISEN